MEHGSLVDDPLSPESTVTSLLSSSGHLRSSLRPPEHSTSFRYRNKEYESASAALEAYIADFEKICQKSCPCTGKLVQPDNLLSTPSITRAGTLRNRDVLMESLTERELDFLDLPVSSLHHAGNRDRLSMTTDELLSIPHDGSMPVTHTSAFIQGLLSQSASSRPHCSFSTPGHKICTGLSSSTMSRQNHQHPHLVSAPRSVRFTSLAPILCCRRSGLFQKVSIIHESLPLKFCSGRPGAATFKTLDDICSSAHRAARSEWTEPSSLRFRPDQFTSSKADMERSGMSDMPDLQYDSNVEAWIQCCDHSKVHRLSDDHAPRTKAPSWVAELEDDDDSIKTCSQVNSQQTLGDLKLQFAEQILLLVEKKSSDIKETMFRDNRIESLIQKADQVLNSLSLRCEGADSLSGSSETSTSDQQKHSSVRPVDTEELLLRSPSHYPVFTLRDSSAAAGASTEPQSESRDQVVQNLSCHPHGNSMEKQPGPVEALKQMLFRLQAVEVKLQGQQHVAPVAPADWLQTEETTMEQKTEGEAELENFSGGPSLHRALHHLNRLKLLVEEPSEKHREEKDEDERCYSSSSAERLICTQQKPT